MAWSGVEAHMQQVLQEFEQVNKSKNHTRIRITKYAGYDLIYLLCNLPAERFSKMLNDYALQLMQLAIKKFNKRQRTLAFELMSYARSLPVSEDMMKSILDKENEMQEFAEKKG